MILLADAGNTALKLYIVDEKYKKVKKYIIEKDTNYVEKLTKIVTKNKVDKCLLSSVTPSINEIFVNIIPETIIFDYQNFDLMFKVENKVNGTSEMGNDRVVVIGSARRKYGENLIIFDLGTALKVEVIKDGFYKTGYIFPGFDLIKNSLIGGTELLKKFEYAEIDQNFQALTTNSQLSDGISIAIYGAIKQYIEFTKNHFNQTDNYKVIITGGGSNILSSCLGTLIENHPDWIFDQEIMFEGLKYLALNLIKDNK